MKSNCDNHYVFLLQHFLIEKEIVTSQETTDKTTVFTEYKFWVSKRKTTDRKVFLFFFSNNHQPAYFCFVFLTGWAMSFELGLVIRSKNKKFFRPATHKFVC